MKKSPEKHTNNSYILLARSIIDSDVFASQKLLKIWVWCLCKANFRDKSAPLKIGRGETIVKVKRGSFIFGRNKAEEELFIDGSTIYKSIKKLESMEMIKIESNSQYSVITISNYDSYQDANNYQVTTKEQPSNNQVTTKEQPSNTTNNDKNDKNDKNVNNNINVPSGNFIIPLISEIDAYCQERKNNVNPNKFYDFYESKGWMVGKTKMKNWKAAIRTWEEEKNKTNYKLKMN